MVLVGEYILINAHHSVKGPELINMYVGQSEQNIREGLFTSPPPHSDYTVVYNVYGSVYTGQECYSLCDLF